MQSPTTMRSPSDERGADGSRRCDLEPDAAPLPLCAVTGGSACTAVGAELLEAALLAGWVCEPPGFIAAESSRAAGPVEAKCTEFAPRSGGPRETASSPEKAP